MKFISLKILKYVAKKGDVPLTKAINLCGKRTKNHKEQYPLALLISEEFLGITVPFPEIKNTEKMPEFMGAISLYMNRLERDDNGEVEYNGITLSGSSFDKERVFIRAKGALYLDELNQKRRDLVISFLIGFFAVLLPLMFSNIDVNDLVKIREWFEW